MDLDLNLLKLLLNTTKIIFYKKMYNSKKFNWYLFLACLFRTNFVFIKTASGLEYFKLVKSKNSIIEIHNVKFFIDAPPIWIKIIHFVDVQKGSDLQAVK